MKFSLLRTNFILLSLLCWITFDLLEGVEAKKKKKKYGDVEIVEEETPAEETENATLEDQLALEIQNAIAGQIDPNLFPQSLTELVSLVQLTTQGKFPELEALLSRATCDTKRQFRDCLFPNDVISRFGVSQTSVMSVILLSMLDCPAAEIHATRLKFLLTSGSARVRDITEVLVTVSESAELHDAFISNFNLGQATLESCLENKKEIGLDGDVENICFELKDRKRVAGSQINVQETAEKLKKEMEDKAGWDDGWQKSRQDLDTLLIEAPCDQVSLVLGEFKNINNGVPIEEAFAKEFGDDVHKLTVYKQLVEFSTNKTLYLVNEILSKLTENGQHSLPIANAIAILGTLSKEEREKIEAEYRAKTNIGLQEQIDQIMTNLGAEGILVQIMELYMDNLKKREA